MTQLARRPGIESEIAESVVDGSSVCPECGAAAVVRDETETVCEECGLVIRDDPIDHGREWRPFEPRDRESKSRIGLPTMNRLHDHGLMTVIDRTDRDAAGDYLSDNTRRRFRRLRTWQVRIRTIRRDEWNLQLALTKIERMLLPLGRPSSPHKVAAALYRRTTDKEVIKGRSIEGVVAGSLYSN